MTEASQTPGVSPEWLENELRLTGAVVPVSWYVDQYAKAMEGKLCTVCGVGFPKSGPGWLMGKYYDRMLDRHVEWDAEHQAKHGYVHTNCHDFASNPGANYQFIT